jgi:hypothetical protein
MLMSDTALANPPAVDPGSPASTGQDHQALPSTAADAQSNPASVALEQTALPSLRERLAWYLGTIVLTSVLICTGLRLDQADLRAPFYYDLDSLLILPMVKSTLERGFGGHWRTDRLGAPEHLEMHDFPVIDHLHFFLIWLLGKVLTNVIVVYNLYYLLTYPLTALSAMIVFRHLRLSLPAAAVGGLLYAFLPYHYHRWENHYFLSAYWLVPLSLMPALDIARGVFPFFRRTGDRSYALHLWSWASLGTVVLGAATASAGAYYAFFTCAYTAFSGLYGVLVFRCWQPGVSAVVFAGVIMAAGFLNHLPSFVHEARYGRNPITDRFPEESDLYGLKIAHLVLPIEDHNLTYFARLKWFYNSAIRPLENENRSASLGIVGTVGLIGLLISLLLPDRRGWPYTPLAAMALFGILLGCIGGFGSIFNLLFTANIRGYNRISVFISFFCLCAVLWPLDRYLTGRRWPIPALSIAYIVFPPLLVTLLLRRSPTWQARIDGFQARLRERKVSGTWFVWGSLALIGFLDETPYSWFKPGIIHTLDEQAHRFQSDSRFFSRIEEIMPAGAAIFCMPYISYPESPPLHKLAAYDHVRGYIHTDTLRWSFAAMKGREVDAWINEVSFRGPEELLNRIVYRGFEGLLVDRRGYAPTKDTNTALTLIQQTQERYTSLVKNRTGQRNVPRLPEIIHEDGQQFFLDLRPYRDELRALSPADFEMKVREEREYAAVIWLGGFYAAEGPTGDLRSLRFGPPDAAIWVINPSDRTRRFEVSLTFSSLSIGAFQFHLSGLVDDDFVLERDPKSGERKTYRIEVPPGRATIRVRCTPPPHFLPADVRKLCYTVKDFRMTELGN